MISERIHHYLGLFFILSLILTQSLVYVAVTAQDSMEVGSNRGSTFRAIFIQPTAGQTITIGQLVSFQAQLSPVNNYSAVTFSVQPSIGGSSLNFESSLQSDGSWKANNVWDTSLLAPGNYNLKASASIYDTAGLLQNSYVSAAQNVVLIEPVANPGGNSTSSDSGLPPAGNPAPISAVSSWRSPQEGQTISLDKNKGEKNIKIELSINKSSDFTINRVAYDIYYRASSAQEFSRLVDNLSLTDNQSTSTQYLYSTLLDAGQYASGDYKLRSRAEVVGSGATTTQSLELSALNFKLNVLALSLPMAKFSSPLEAQVLSSPTGITLELSRALDTGHSLRAYLIEKNLATSPVLSKYTNRIIPLANSSDKPLNYKGILEPVKYPAGDYSLLVYDLTAAKEILIGSVSIKLAALSANQIIVMTSPESGSAIKENSVYFSIRTAALADALDLELISAESPAISTGEIAIEKTDGTNWNKTLWLDDSFIDGLYNVIINTQLAPQQQATTTPSLQARYSLFLNRQKESLDTKSVSLILDTPQAQSNTGQDFGFTGLVNVSATSNIRSGQVYFVLKNSLEKNEALRLVHNNIQEVTGANNAVSYKYGSIFDTSAVANGNYYLSAEIYYNNKLITTSDQKLISVYNVVVIEDSLTLDDKDVSLQWLKTYKLQTEFNKIVIYILSNLRPRPEALTLALRDEQSNTLDQITFQTIGAQTAFKLGFLDNINRPALQAYRGIWLASDVKKFSANPVLNLAYIDSDGQIKAQSNRQKFVIKNNEIQAEADTYAATPEDNALLQPTVESTSTIAQANIVLPNNLAVGLTTTCAQMGITKEQSCQSWKAMLEDSVDSRCRQQNIFTGVACEDYLNRTIVDLECQAQGLVDRERCKDYLMEKYGGQVGCRLPNQSSCNGILREQYLNRLVLNQKDAVLVKEAIGSLLGQTLNLAQIQNQLTAKGAVNLQWSLRPDGSERVLLAPAQSITILEQSDQLTVNGEVILITDSDGDGLPDDLERYYGTDPNKADSDNDSYSDSTEIKNLFNPLGEGSLSKENTPLDQTLFYSHLLEQPQVFSNKQSSDIKVSAIDNIAPGIIKLSGQAPVNSWVNIYFYSSMPLLVTTPADASGQWQYTLNQALADGNHRLYVANIDNGGNIVRQSAPLSLLIKDKQAVSPAEYFDIGETKKAANDSLLIYYIVGGIVLLALLLIPTIFFLRRKQNLPPSQPL
ncbi:MAG: hypothetical protein C3F02_04325 [Parcubacteria group bacterium]|nr:MAG: hypothetical protein C3F02_04325 [Parcubacteria group bacterium]